MKRFLFSFLVLLLCFTTITAFAAEKKSSETDKLLTKNQVMEALKDLENTSAYVQIDDNAFKVYPAFTDKKAVRKQLLKNLPTNKVLYFISNNEDTFYLAFSEIKDLETSGRLYDNCRYMGGVDETNSEIEKETPGKRFWFMKIPRGSTAYNDGVNVGIGIGIGRWHRGGIGIGW